MAYDIAGLLKTLVDNAHSRKTLLSLLLTGLVFAVAHIGTLYFPTAQKIIRVLPIWVWFLILFPGFYLLLDNRDIKNRRKKNLADKKRSEQEAEKQDRLWAERMRERLIRLTDEEKEVLKGYISNKSYTQALSLDSGVVGGLIDDEIIYKSSDFPKSSSGFVFDFNINKAVFEYLNANKELISKDVPDTEQIA